MKNKIFLPVTITLTFLIAGTGIFLLIKKQADSAPQFFASTAEGLKDQISIPSATPTASTEDEIAALKKEIEELKSQQKTNLKPVASPQTDLKTQQELDKAKREITSLEKKLQQTSGQQQSSSGDSNLIKNWHADAKVVRVACLNSYLSVWQMGSGTIVSADGNILTNRHVVEPSGVTNPALPEYCIILFNTDYNSTNQTYIREYRATISGFFEGRDAALLKIKDYVYKDNQGNLVPVSANAQFEYFALQTEKPQIGDNIYVIGYPESASFAFSVTKGIISNFTQDNLYFGTDAQVDRGNSGGAAIDSSGKLFGIPTWKYAGSGDYRGYILDINTIHL